MGGVWGAGRIAEVVAGLFVEKTGGRPGVSFALSGLGVFWCLLPRVYTLGYFLAPLRGFDVSLVECWSCGIGQRTLAGAVLSLGSGD